MDPIGPDGAIATAASGPAAGLNSRSAAAAREEATDLLIHDIRTPLAAISGYDQLLLRQTVTRDPDLASLEDGLHRIQDAATRVAHLLDELTDVSLPRLEEPTASANGLTWCTLSSASPRRVQSAARGNSQLVVLPAVPDLVGWWNPVRVERTLANLIDNALKYNRCDRPVVVNIKPAGNWAVISTADAGLGIGAGQRAPDRRRIQRHISLDSQMGIGTTASVRLPLGGTTP